jgi:hypothetical protein
METNQKKLILNSQLVELCKEYKITITSDSIYLVLCSKVKKMSKKDQIRFVNAVCNHYQINDNDYVLGVIETYGLNISVKDLYEKRGIL